MQLIRRQAHARAGLVGNPSDGYNGRTVSISVQNFRAEVVLYEWHTLEIVFSEEDKTRFRSLKELSTDVVLHGYYGGVRLVKATIKTFSDYCERLAIPLHDRNFSIRYESNIPRNVGLAGSSAIIVATLRALLDFYQVTIPLEVQPSLALSVENNELKIPGGLQDRVIQVYEGCVSMDFSKEHMTEQQGYLCGVYERLDPALLPPLYVAYAAEFGEPTEVVHNDLRGRFNRGDPNIITAMQKFADLAAAGRDAIVDRDYPRLARLMDENFDTRRSICQLHQGHVAMIEAARSVGASAKFAGSGGAIVGTYRDEQMLEDLKTALGGLNCVVLKPQIV